MSPRPPVALFENPLEVAMRQMQGLEAHYAYRARGAEDFPQAYPQTGCLDADLETGAALVPGLRLIPEIGEQYWWVRADQQQRIRAGEPRQVPDVWQARYEHRVEMLFDEPRSQARQTCCRGIAHFALSRSTSPLRASSYP